MKTVKNFYFILGISRDACKTEIDAAYESWKAAAADDEYQALMAAEKAEAYEHLSDPELRKQHDELLGAPSYVSVGGGNVHHFRSAEAGVAVQIEFNRQLKKQKALRNLVRTATAALILIAVVVFGIRYLDKFFSKAPTLPDASSAVNAQSAIIPIPEPEQAAPSAETTTRTGTTRGAQSVITTYAIPTGGVVIRERAQCRPQPSFLSRPTSTMRRDTAILVTGETRDENRNLWYHVKTSQFEGWVSAGDVQIYK